MYTLNLTKDELELIKTALSDYVALKVKHSEKQKIEFIKNNCLTKIRDAEKINEKYLKS